MAEAIEKACDLVLTHGATQSKIDNVRQTSAVLLRLLKIAEKVEMSCFIGRSYGH